MKPKPSKPARRYRVAKHYSGPRSIAFWQEVNRRDDPTLYLLACTLQDIEGRMLQLLNTQKGQR